MFAVGWKRDSLGEIVPEDLWSLAVTYDPPRATDPSALVGVYRWRKSPELETEIVICQVFNLVWSSPTAILLELKEKKRLEKLH